MPVPSVDESWELLIPAGFITCIMKSDEGLVSESKAGPTFHSIVHIPTKSQDWYF